MKNFLTKVIDLIPYVIFVVLIGSILIPLTHFGLTYDRLIDLINALIWPTIALCALIFFRKVFTYLFFSMEEFNFFGTRGRLKDVQQMIRMKADDLKKIEQDQERLNAERAEHQKELKAIINDRDEGASIRGRILKLAEGLSDENDKLQKQNLDLKKKAEILNNLLMSQSSQKSSEFGVESVNQEEVKDVGSTNPESETSVPSK